MAGGSPARYGGQNRLGCLSDIQVFVTDKCSAPRLCALTNITRVEWNRKLDDISEATVEVALNDPECCECMSNIEPWCHMLHIIRNGEIVWQGVIIRITYGFTKVTIQAQDILAFLKVTVPQTVIDNRKSPGNEITDLAKTVLQTGFAERQDARGDDCFLSHVVQTDLLEVNGKNQRPTTFAATYISPLVGFAANTGTVFDWLTILAENGLDYTVIGLTIVLSVQDANLQPIGVLTDDMILGEVEVSKDGTQMVNRAYVRYPGDDSALATTTSDGIVHPGCKAQCEAAHVSGTVCAACGDNGNVQPCYLVPCPALSEASNKYCYGPIERLFNTNDVGDYATAKQTADAYVKAGSIAPRTLEFPGGTKLSPDTPWDINDMVPGQLINVALTQLCLDSFQSFKLLEVDYTLQSGEDEIVSISLGAFNQVGSTL